MMLNKIIFYILIIYSFLMSPDSILLFASDKVADIDTPKGFTRQLAVKNSFASFLRHLNLKSPHSPVKLYNGDLKTRQDIHYRVLDMDIGTKDLQQCADAVIRLRSEYLYSINSINSIHFNFTSGDTARYSSWIKGYRPKVDGDKVSWIQSAPFDNSYKCFREYLNVVFMYAGSFSLKKELLKVVDLRKIDIGDLFIQGGFPGHAVIVLDIAYSNDREEIAILLAQSYMPAQDIHILINENNVDVSPWYILGKNEKLFTPEWTFEWNDLYEFKNDSSIIR